MALDDIDKTAFTCHMGTYEYLKMAVGPRQRSRDLPTCP